MSAKRQRRGGQAASAAIAIVVLRLGVTGVHDPFYSVGPRTNEVRTDDPFGSPYIAAHGPPHYPAADQGWACLQDVGKSTRHRSSS